MKNCIVLGAGRSGTSMLAGMLSGVGYYMGANLLAPNQTNPKGFFEDYNINLLNEEILASVTPRRPRFLSTFFQHLPQKNQRWLAKVKPEQLITCNEEIRARIKQLLARETPFCYKDPRFSYTLGCWRPLLTGYNPLYLCVFRSPSDTAESICKEVASATHLNDFHLTYLQASEVWYAMYQYILKRHHAQDGSWVFVHYDQIADGSILGSLSEKLGVEITPAFFEPKLRRTRSSKPIGTKLHTMYQSLCELAHYQPQNSTI